MCEYCGGAGYYRYDLPCPGGCQGRPGHADTICNGKGIIRVISYCGACATVTVEPAPVAPAPALAIVPIEPDQDADSDYETEEIEVAGEYVEIAGE